MLHILSYVPLLACPAGMALMMLMMRGKPAPPQRSVDEPRIARLERELELLRAENRDPEGIRVDRAS